MQVTRQSQLTGLTHTIDLDVTWEQLDRFDNRRVTGEYVQTIFPNLPPAQREFLLTGITPDEWSKAFGEHE